MDIDFDLELASFMDPVTAAQQRVERNPIAGIAGVAGVPRLPAQQPQQALQHQQAQQQAQQQTVMLTPVHTRRASKTQEDLSKRQSTPRFFYK